MSTETALLAIYFVGLGSAFLAWGMLNLRRERKRKRAIEAGRLACTCPALLADCACANECGVRNPRGAGRGREIEPSRPWPRYATPPVLSKCRQLRAYGPTPCRYPHCDCFEVRA